MESYLNHFKDAKRSFQMQVLALGMRKMLADNLSHLFPPTVHIKTDYFESRTVLLEFNEEGVTADIFDKTVALLSKRFRMQPDIYISKYSMDASWPFYFTVKNRRVSIYIDLTTSNTESCEIITKTVTKEETELTGYCKLLQEKKYFDDN